MAKEKLKRDYDRGARLRSFDVGEMVLMRIPGLASKFEDAWDGPYEINRKLSDVNYEICVPNCRRKTKIVHVKNMKAWVAQQAQVFRIVVFAEDDNLEREDKIKLRGSRLTDDRKKELDKLLQEYEDVLDSSPGLTGAVVHSIDTGDSKPIRSLPYRLCPAWCQQVRNEIDSLLAGDIIEPCVSPLASPSVPIKKRDGTLRLCVNFRKLNTVTVPDPFCIPLVKDILDQVADCSYLSKLDLSKGFYQVPINPHDSNKTSFCTLFGKFHFKRMPFGLMNAHSTFQRLMQSVLQGQEDHSSPYIDDVVIFSMTWEEHLNYVKQVLSSLRKYGLTTKPSKCVWAAEEIEYLGHVVGKGRVSVPEARVHAIKNFRKPVTKRDMRSFLTVGYYRKFIPKFADLV